jgi:hypothetical protein
MPPICLFNLLKKNDEEILFIDPDAGRENSFFVIVNNEDKIIRELSFKELYEEIDYLLENGWSERDSFIKKDIKTWIKDFAEKYEISLE